MTPLAIGAVAALALYLLLQALERTRDRLLALLLPFLALALCALNYTYDLYGMMVGGFFFYLTPVYLFALLASLHSLWRLTIGRHRSDSSQLLRWTALTLGAAALVLPVAMALRPQPKPTDFSTMSWSEGFEALNAKLAAEYPFTELKRIDWDAKYRAFSARVAAAEADGDRDAYYRALREYAYSIPDGHVRLGGDDRGLEQRSVGGVYGLGIIGLEDGRIVAHIVSPGGPAERAGLKWGAEILEWNGRPVRQALESAPTIWARLPTATAEGRRLEQYRFLVRGPVGSTAQVTFRNPGGAIGQAALEAYDDKGDLLYRTRTIAMGPFNFRGRAIDHEIRPDGIGYIQIHVEMPTVLQPFPARALAGIVRRMKQQGVRGIVVDLRRNRGGADALVAAYVTPFMAERTFYEDVSFYNKEQRRFVVDPSYRLWVEPSDDPYRGPLAVLVDKGSTSGGDCLAMLLARRPNTRLFGYEGTNGSFAVGAPSGTALLPDGLSFTFYPGRSLDIEGRIQGDSDHRGVGGVDPDVRVPRTLQTMHADFVQGGDAVLAAAIADLRRRK